MESNDITIITRFISAIAWQLSGIIFLCSSIILLMISGLYNVFAWAFLVLFIGCSAMSIKRKAEVFSLEYGEVKHEDDE